MSPQLQQLYSLLEVDFNPLVLCEKAEPLLTQLEANEETKQYVEPLKEVTLVRLVKQVCMRNFGPFACFFRLILTPGVSDLSEYSIDEAL